MKCCGWTGPSNWTENILIKSEKNNSQNLYPCSCRNVSISGTDLKETGLCPSLSSEWPVFTTVQTYSFTAHIDTSRCKFLLKLSLNPIAKASTLVFHTASESSFSICATFSPSFLLLLVQHFLCRLDISFSQPFSPCQSGLGDYIGNKQ